MADTVSTEWLNRAACRDEDGELFFATGNSGPALLQIAEAKTVCRRCPTVSQCLDLALTMGLDHGVFGGLSEDERRALKRRQSRTRARSNAAEKAAELLAQFEPGAVVAAPSTSHKANTGRRHPRLHVVGEGDRSLCDTAFVDLRHAELAVDVPRELRCSKTECRRAFLAATRERVVPDPTAPVVAVAGESVLHERTSRWHPLDADGVPACGVLVPRVLRKLAREVEPGRRCRQVRCRRAWARLDADLAVSHG